MDIKDQIRDKKVELFDLQLLLGTLQNQLQAKMSELNELIKQNKQEEEKNVPNKITK